MIRQQVSMVLWLLTACLPGLVAAADSPEPAQFAKPPTAARAGGGIRIDFTSSRIKNYEFSKQFYMLVDQLWVK